MAVTDDEARIQGHKRRIAGLHDLEQGACLPAGRGGTKINSSRGTELVRRGTGQASLVRNGDDQ